MTPKFLFFRSSRIQYHVVGEGEPLLLVHGYQADSRIWEKMVPLLKEHFMLIIPDLPGHGQSPLIQATNDMDFLADVLYSIILSGGHSGISIAGHSMGGYAAMAFADKYPNLTDRLILLNTHPFEDGMNKMLARNREAEIIQEGKKEILLRNFVQNNFNRSSSNALKEEIQLATQIALSQPENGMLADLAGMMARKPRIELVQKKRLQADFILGMADSRIPIKFFEQLNKELVNIHWLADCGHMSMLEKPAEVAEIILKL
ncbi:MAG TPA: hypothetical protein DDX98_07815 [Bacteroidales bacterium]|jgi:pimeloyl-ACP methyl ester carboxylesterase|nr:hypothetical protein [Bacteroidales bacterium]